MEKERNKFRDNDNGEGMNIVSLLHEQRDAELREMIGRAYEVRHDIYVPVEKKKWWRHPWLSLMELSNHLRRKKIWLHK